MMGDMAAPNPLLSTTASGDQEGLGWPPLALVLVLRVRHLVRSTIKGETYSRRPEARRLGLIHLRSSSFIQVKSAA
jgi:hypothetical protein